MALINGVRHEKQFGAQDDEEPRQRALLINEVPLSLIIWKKSTVTARISTEELSQEPPRQAA